MKNYKLKYMNVEDCKAINKMVSDGQRDTLIAFGREYLNYNKVEETHTVVTGVVIGIVAGTLMVIGKKAYKKWKEQKEDQIEEKPEREYLKV